MQAIVLHQLPTGIPCTFLILLLTQTPACACLYTLQEGQLKVEREKVTIETPELDPSLIFEQDPVQILDALLPLYMNSCLLRSLQEALASELAARMNAMNSATDNAKELKKVRDSCNAQVTCVREGQHLLVVATSSNHNAVHAADHVGSCPLVTSTLLGCQASVCKHVPH